MEVLELSREGFYQLVSLVSEGEWSVGDDAAGKQAAAAGGKGGGRK